MLYKPGNHSIEDNSWVALGNKLECFIPKFDDRQVTQVCSSEIPN